MYAERLRSLKNMYKSISRNNDFYTNAVRAKDANEHQLNFLFTLHEQLKSFNLAVTKKESEWRSIILSVLETEIIKDLAYVFPDDGYTVKLSSEVFRGKIQVNVEVSSYNVNNMPGKITGTQGRLFQQVVSFSALIAVMSLLGVKTIYIDEAFSGVAKSNIKSINNLLLSVKERGYNLIIIAQDSAMADCTEANIILLDRSKDNKTIIVQNEGGDIAYE